MNGLEVLVGYNGTTSPTLAFAKTNYASKTHAAGALLLVFRRAAIWDERADH